jgi:hypothetical protein
MPSNLLFIPLLGGYWFAHHWYSSKFRAHRMDGYRLLLDSAVYGVFFAAIARCLVFAVALLNAKPLIRAGWVQFAGDQSYAGTAFLAFLLALPAPYVINALSAIWHGGIRNAIAQVASQPFQHGNTATAARSILEAFLDPARAAAKEAP